MKRIAMILSTLFLCGVLMSAQIKVDAPGVVGLNEQFNITFSLTEKPSGFEWAPGNDFQLVWGPQTGSSTSISIVNGKTTRSSSYTYTYVLVPVRSGSFTLSPAKAVVGGNEVYSRAPVIEVVSDGASQSGANPSGGNDAFDNEKDPGAEVQQRKQASNTADIFMRFSLSRTNVVVGEPITATLKLFTRGGIAGFEDAVFPTFNGFWAQEIEAPQNIQFHRETIGDRIYDAAVLRRWIIIPQKAGAVKIDPAELVCLVQQRISTGGNSIFDGFFDDYQTIRRRVVTDAYTVNVSQLPAGAPSSFTGAVGSYKISASLDRDSLKVHDAASLTVTISGKGNVALIGAPKVSFPPDAEVYDTKTSDRLDKSNGGTSGTRLFEYPFIPRSHGDFEIPPVEFSYYDISARKYVTIHTDPVAFNVAPGESKDYVPAEGVNIPVAARKDVRNLSEDIHYISTKIPELSSESVFLIGSRLFYVLVAAIILIAAAAYFVIRSSRKTRSNVALVRTKGASKMARKRLSNAKSYLDSNLYSAFYEELHKALLGYASDKLNIGVADLSREGISAAFADAGVASSLCEEFSSLVDQCEFARYSPQGGTSTMQEAYDRAADVISSIDANMKKNPLKGVAAILLPLMFIIPSVCVNAASTQYVDSLWNQAAALYAEGEYDAAQKNFSAIENLGLSSPELYTNIADSYFKSGNIPAAVLYYERALKLDPSYKDARYNIEIARTRVQDHIDVVPEFFLKNWARKLCYSLPSNVWTWMGLALLALSAVLLVIFLLSRRSAPRRLGFFGSVLCILLFIQCIVNASWQKNDFQSRDSAIVMRPVCSVKSAPSGTNDLFVVHEGTKVSILDTVGDWTNISLSDGREGWLKTSDITVI